MVGSDCSFIFCLSRLTKTAAIARALLGLAGLLLDDGGQDDELLRRLERQVGIAALPDLVAPAGPAPDCIRWIICSRDEAAVEMIAVRQQRSFAREFLDVAGKHVVLQQARDDLFGGQALRNGQLVLHHLAFDDRLDHVAHAGMLLKQVFAGLESAARLEREHAADKDDPVLVNDAFALEQIGDVHHAGAGRDGDDLVFRQRPRRLEPALAEDDDPAADQQRQNKQGEDRIADDDQRIARAPRGAFVAGGRPARFQAAGQRAGCGA